MKHLLSLRSLSELCGNYSEISQSLNSVKHFSFHISQNQSKCFHLYQPDSYFAFYINEGENVRFGISKQKYFLKQMKIEFSEVNQNQKFYYTSARNHLYIVFQSNISQNIKFASVLFDKNNCNIFGVSNKENNNITIKARNYCYADITNGFIANISIHNHINAVFQINNNTIKEKYYNAQIQTPFFLIYKNNFPMSANNTTYPSLSKEYIKNNNIKTSKQSHFINILRLSKLSSTFLKNNDELNQTENEVNDENDSMKWKLKIIGISIGSYYGVSLILCIFIILLACKYPNRFYSNGFICKSFYCMCMDKYEKFVLFYTQDLIKHYFLCPCHKYDKYQAVDKYPSNTLPIIEYKQDHPEYYEPNIIDDLNNNLSQKTKDLIEQYNQESFSNRTYRDMGGSAGTAGLICFLCCICAIPLICLYILYIVYIIALFPFVELFVLICLMSKEKTIEEQIFQSSNYELIPERCYRLNYFRAGSCNQK